MAEAAAAVHEHGLYLIGRVVVFEDPTLARARPGALNAAAAAFYYLRVVVYMWLRNEPVGSVPRMNPALAATIVITLGGTLLLGLYPSPLFNFAELSARALGAVAATAAR